MCLLRQLTTSHPVASTVGVPSHLLCRDDREIEMRKLHKFVGILLVAMVSTSKARGGPESPEVIKAAPVSSSVSRPGAEIAASNDGSAVSLKLTKETSTIPLDPNKDGLVTFDWLSVTASAPISKSETSHSLFSLDGWGNATTLGLSYSTFLTSWQPADPEQAKLRSLYCQEMHSAAAKQMVKESPGTTDEEAAKASKELDCTKSNYQKYLPTRVDAARAGMGMPAPGGVLIGASAKYGTQNSKFYDASTLEKKENRYSPWSVNIFVGWNPKSSQNTMVIFKAEKKRTYEDAESATKCPVVAGALILTCTSGSFGAPEKKTSSNGSVEVRRLIDKSIAAAIVISRDLSEKVTTTEIPVYWLGNASGSLNGGLKFGTNSKDKKWSAGVFVGIPFGLWASPE